jgi:hypothetical protein
VCSARGKVDPGSLEWDDLMRRWSEALTENLSVF